MSRVGLDFSANTAEAERKIQSLTKENNKLRDSIRLLGEASKQGFSQGGKVVAEFSDRMRDATKAVKKWSEAAEGQAKGSEVWARAVGEMSQKMLASRYSFEVGIAKMREQDKVTRGLESAFTSFAGRLASFAGPAAIAAAGAALVTKAYSGWRQELEQLAEKQREFAGGFTKGVALTPDAARAGEISDLVHGVKGVKREDVQATFEGLTAEAPTQSLDRRKEITKSLSRLSPTGVDMRTIGGLAGQLATIMPEKTGGDISDLATLFAQQSGGHLERFEGEKFQSSLRNMVQAGVPADEALAMGLSAAQGHVKGTVMSKVADIVGASEKQLRPSAGDTSPEGRAKRKLAHMSGIERYRALQGDSALASAALGETEGLSFARMKPEQIASNLAMIRATGTEDTTGRVLAESQSSAEGRSVATKYQLEQQDSSRKAAIRERESLYEQMDAAARQQFRPTMAGRMAGEIAVAGRKFGTTIRDTLHEQSPMEMEGGNVNLRVLVDLMRTQTGYLAEMAKKEPSRRRDINSQTEDSGR